jgi:hypothetical protein
MAVDSLYDKTENKSVLYCNTTGWAFGPVFDSTDADTFLTLCQDEDPCAMSEEELKTRVKQYVDAGLLRVAEQIAL